MKSKAKALKKLIENSGMDTESLIRFVLKCYSSGQFSLEEAADQLLQEIGRGSRIIVVDENLAGLEEELAELNYTVYTVSAKSPDWEIKSQIGSRIFVTRNGIHFYDPKDMARYRYGLIWIVSKSPHRELAQKVKKAIMAAHFGKNLVQVRKV